MINNEHHTMWVHKRQMYGAVKGNLEQHWSVNHTVISIAACPKCQAMIRRRDELETEAAELLASAARRSN